MTKPTISEFKRLKNLAKKLPRKIPYLKMLILFGSRARGDTHAKSDWDFAALFDNEQREACVKDTAFGWFEVPSILGDIFEINSEEIDIVELNRCSALITHFIARDGILIYEEIPGEFYKFKESHLKTDAEMKEIRKKLREEIETRLQAWGV